MKKFMIPPLNPDSIGTFCQFLNRDGKMKACTLDPEKCLLGFLVKSSKDGGQMHILNAPLNHELIVKETLDNCPKLKPDNRRWTKLLVKEAMRHDRI